MSKLINISEASSIAIHCMALIAQSEERLNANKMAEITGFSRNHMAKVLQILVKFNYLTSTRGPSGGFILKKDPSEVNLLEIYEIIEGKLQSSHCGLKNDFCPFGECVFGNITQQLTQEFRQYFKQRTLADIIPHQKLNLKIETK